MKNIAEKRCGRPVTKAVVTCPAYFNATQRQSTRDAAIIAGLEPLRIINEPTAAALTSGFQNSNEEKNLLVFDFGGGTLDISLIISSSGCFNVQSTCGDNLLGGVDLD